MGDIDGLCEGARPDLCETNLTIGKRYVLAHHHARALTLSHSRKPIYRCLPQELVERALYYVHSSGRYSSVADLSSSSKSDEQRMAVRAVEGICPSVPFSVSRPFSQRAFSLVTAFYSHSPAYHCAGTCGRQHGRVAAMDYPL